MINLLDTKDFITSLCTILLAKKFLVVINITNSDCSVSQSECFIMNQFVNVVTHDSIFIEACVILCSVASLSFF